MWTLLLQLPLLLRLVRRSVVHSTKAAAVAGVEGWKPRGFDVDAAAVPVLVDAAAAAAAVDDGGAKEEKALKRALVMLKSKAIFRRV